MQVLVQGLDFCCCNMYVDLVIPACNEIGTTLMYLYCFFKARSVGLFPKTWKGALVPATFVGISWPVVRAAFYLIERKSRDNPYSLSCGHREFATWLQGFVMVGCRLLSSLEEDS